MSKLKDGFWKDKGILSDDYVLLAAGGHMMIHTGRNNEANKIVRTDSNGWLLTGWIETTSGDLGTGAFNKIYVSNDNWIRYVSKSNFIEGLNAYWANVKVSNTSNISTTPTFGKITIIGGFPHIDMTSTSAESSIYFKPNSGTQWAIGKAPWGVGGFGIGILGTGSKLTILDNGNVGIGNDSPSEKLHVLGNIKAYHIYPNSDLTYDLGSSSLRYLNIYGNILRLQGASSNPSATAGARIEFTYDNGTSRSQPVYISYTPNDSYRSPAGLKIFGGTDASPAWLEVEGGFIKTGSSNSYVLLGGGGHKLESSLSVSNADKVDGYHFSDLEDRYVNITGDWMNWNAQIYFKGKGESTSVYSKIGYATSASSQTMHCVNTSGHQADGAFYITSNGSTSANDTGGLAIDNEGVTVFGAGDAGSNFTGVFRVLNEDNVADGPQFLVTKNTGAAIKYSLSVGQNTVNTSYNLYVNGTSYFNGNVTHNGVIYLANGTTYWIDNSAIGYLNDLRVDQMRLVDNWIGWYSANNAGGSRYGYIQANGTYMYFVKENGNSGFNFNGNIVPSSTNALDLGTNALRWRTLYLKGGINYIMDADTSNAKCPLIITNTSNTQVAEIGYHNTGDTNGAFVITPYAHSGTNFWAGTIGLYIGKNNLKWENKYIARFAATPVDGRIIVASGTIGNVTNGSYTIAGLFTDFSNYHSGTTHQLSITVGGTTRRATPEFLAPYTTLTYGNSGLQYFNINGTAGVTPNANVTPTSAWYHILRMNHANANGYFADIAIPINDVNGIYWRQVRIGNNYGWYRLCTPSIEFTGGSSNDAGHRLIYQWSTTAWLNHRMSFAVRSRHTGSGIISVTFGCNNATVSKANCYAQIKYYGNTGSGSVIDVNSFKIHISDDGTKAYLFWYYSDYTNTIITPLTSDAPYNGTWITGAVPTATYGAQFTNTQINVADSLSNPGIYYWANLPMQTSSSTTTTPQFGGLYVINDSSNNGYDSLVYVRGYTSNDWGLIVDKSQSYTYGVDIRAGGEYALRVYNGKTRLVGATTIGGDTPPSYTLDTRGTIRATSRIYANEWIEFSGAATGLYWPNANNASHFHPNDATTYGQFVLRGSRGGYSGITLARDANYMTIMDNSNDKGLYQQTGGVWIIYYNRSNGYVSLRTSSNYGGNINLNGKTWLRYDNTSTNSPAFVIHNNTFASAGFQWASDSRASAMVTDSRFIHLIGKANSTYNEAYFGYHHKADGSQTNYATIGLYGQDEIVNITGYRRLGINSTAPGYTLHVEGDGYFTNTLHVSSASESALPNVAAIEVRERNRNTTNIAHNYANAPRIGFHWGGRYWSNITYFDNIFRFMNESCNGYIGIAAAAIGRDNYIAYPNGGSYTTTTSSVTGAIRIKVPSVYSQYSMIKFTIEIYDYNGGGNGHGTSSTYTVGGHNWKYGTWYGTFAYSNRDQLNNKGNLTVRFGNDGTNHIVWIGETNTTWSYPQVIIKDVVVGYSNINYDIYSRNWAISFVTSFNNVTNTLTNPAVNYLSNFAELLYPISSTTTASKSTWNIPSGCKQVWGERFSDNTLKYTPSGGSATTITDTGDWTIWLAPSATSNSASLNMRIDGTYYGAFSGNLSGNATSATQVIVNHNNSANADYPLVWSNLANQTTTTANQLYKSWNNLYYHPSTSTLVVRSRGTSSTGILQLWYNDQRAFEIRADSEGGNINIYSPIGTTYYTNTSSATTRHYWEIDSYNGNLRFYNYTQGSANTAASGATPNGVAGVYRAVTFGRSGSITSPDIVYANTHYGYSGTGYVSSVSGTPWPNLRFDSRAGGSTYVTINQTEWGDLYFQVPAKRASDSYYYRTRFFFRQYSRNASGARVGYYEDYYLPETNDSRGSNASYNILTTKLGTIGSTTNPVYFNNGTPTACSYSLGATVNSGTATRIAYYSGANAISSGSIVTNGSYLRNIGGYNNTTYALSTASFICNSWVRTVGNTGWYNETHDGGWYMSDANWIRTYNSKSVYTNSGQLRSDNIVWGNQVCMTSNWIGIYSGTASGSRYGYIQADASYMYFRKENGNSGFNFNGNLVPSGNLGANLGTNALSWNRTFSRYIDTRHLDATAEYTSDMALYIGYGAASPTQSINFYYSTGTRNSAASSRTHYAQVNSNGLYALVRFGVNGQNTSYNFYVNGTSFFNNVVRIQYNTPNLYIRNTVDTSYSIIRLGTNSNENASYIFQNGPSRTDDGGANVMTIRNNVGVLRLQNRIHIDSTGRVYPEGTNSRRAGMYGVYDSTKIGHIWSMGTAYMIPDNGSTFGNLYGLAYKHTNNSTGGTMAGGHQAVWCDNGSPRAAMGYNGFWAAGGFYKSSSSNGYALSGGGGHKAYSKSGDSYVVTGYDRAVSIRVMAESSFPATPDADTLYVLL